MAETNKMLWKNTDISTISRKILLLEQAKGYKNTKNWSFAFLRKKLLQKSLTVGEYMGAMQHIQELIKMFGLK